MLERQGIRIAAHIERIGNICDARFDPVSVDPSLMQRLSSSSFSLIDGMKEAPMRAEVEAARTAQDSVGGVIECAVTGLPVGVGEPMFDGMEGAIAQAVFGVPAVKGIEFGAGFALAQMRGSQANDPFRFANGRVVTETNRCGGILGGITDGMPVLFRVAVKPTPSISQPQKTVNLQTGENAVLEIHGRHDPCIVPRAVSVIEAVTAIAVINLL